MTALLVRRDPMGLDWLLANPQLDAATLSLLLYSQRLDEVLAQTQPALPVYDILAGPAVRLWQADLVRRAYALRAVPQPTTKPAADKRG